MSNSLNQFRSIQTPTMQVSGAVTRLTVYRAGSRMKGFAIKFEGASEAILRNSNSVPSDVPIAM